MGPAAMPASPPSQIQPPKSARRSYLIVVLCDADVAVDAEPLAVPFRVLRDAGITTSFASPSGRIAPAFDALRIVIEDGGDDDFLVDLLRRGGRKASLKRARAPRISYDGVMFVGPSQSHDPPSVACAKARQIGQRMRDLGCVVGALGSGLAMLAHLNDWLHTHRRAHDLGGDPRAQRDDHVWRLAPCPIRPPPCVTAPWSPPRRLGVRPCTRRRRCFAMPSSTTGSEQSRAGRHLGFH